MDIKITINSENRAVVIPMAYDKDADALSFKEVQIDPIPAKDEDITKDVVLNLTHFIITGLRNL